MPEKGLFHLRERSWNVNDNKSSNCVFAEVQKTRTRRPGKETRVTLIPWVSEEALCWRNLSASRRPKKRIGTYQCPQEHWNFKRTVIPKKTKRPTLQVLKSSQTTHPWSRVLSMRLETKVLTGGQGRKSPGTLEKGFAKIISALTQLEIIPQRLRGTSYGGSVDQQLFGKVREHWKKTVQQGVNIFQSQTDGINTTSTEPVSVPKEDQGETWCSGTTPP